MRSRALFAACTITIAFASAARAQHTDSATAERVGALLSALADDSMEGRELGSRGGAAAARLIAAELARAGLQSAGDSGWFQRVPLARATPFAAVNVVGVLPGSDPRLKDETIVIDAHYDHLGIAATPVGGDSIYNGADDDASGTVAVMEIARMLGGERPAPKRTIVFLLVTGEERGALGSRWYLATRCFRSSTPWPTSRSR